MKIVQDLFRLLIKLPFSRFEVSLAQALERTACPKTGAQVCWLSNDIATTPTRFRFSPAELKSGVTACVVCMCRHFGRKEIFLSKYFSISYKRKELDMCRQLNLLQFLITAVSAILYFIVFIIVLCTRCGG